MKGIENLIKIMVDPHTHTIASGHAFSTISENAIGASEKGLDAIAMTDHFGPMFWNGKNPDFGAMMNMSSLPQKIHGVRVLAGAEIDIIDLDGNLAGKDLYTPFTGGVNACDCLLDSREVAIASLHFLGGMEGAKSSDFTQMYINVINNPKIDIIGHPGRLNIPFDIDEIVKSARDAGTCIEINSSKLMFPDTRRRCREIALCCAENDCPVVISSDAHSAFFIGEVSDAIQMLEEIHFPEKLVINATSERFYDFLGIEK